MRHISLVMAAYLFIVHFGFFLTDKHNIFSKALLVIVIFLYNKKGKRTSFGISGDFQLHSSCWCFEHFYCSQNLAANNSPKLGSLET